MMNWKILNINLATYVQSYLLMYWNVANKIWHVRHHFKADLHMYVQYVAIQLQLY